MGQGIEIDESVTNDPVQANKWYKAICFDHASPKRVAGTALVAGVVGSATITEANRNSGTFNLDAGDTIGSLGVICAPPSGISWTDNYGFLRVVGKLIGVGKDRLSRVRPNFHGSLYKFLVEGFESRGNKAENDKAPYPRPKSMKMCPPNYYMSGITYSKNNSNGQIQGISQIWCKRSETNKVSQLNPYGYWASSPKELSFDLEYDNYFAGQDHSEALPRYFNISVSLDQWIGHPKAPSNATSETLKCTAQNRVMTQLQFKYDSNQKMTKIGIGCSKFSYF